MGSLNRNRQLLRKATALLVGLSVSGCASFDGAQRRVITVDKAERLTASYAPDEAVRVMGSLDASKMGARNTYRSRVVMAYLTAIDANYAVFLRGLSRSGKGLHIGLEALTLGLTGAGAIFPRTASGLAAGATATSGLRSSFDRELFAEKTLPILVSLMDSRRLEVRADILEGLSKPESTYTLEAAFADLMRYESAGSLDNALSDAAAAAGERAQASEYDFSKAKDLCQVDVATDKARRDLMTDLEKFEKEAEKTHDATIATQKRKAIQDAAIALGIAAPITPIDKDSALALLMPVRDQVEAQCDSAGVANLRTTIRTAGVPIP